MCSYLADLIPRKSTSDQICKILKEIYVEEIVEDEVKQILEDSDE